MTCDEVKPLLQARFDDELDERDRAAVTCHLESCPICSHAWEELDAIRHAVRTELNYQKAPLHVRYQIRDTLRAADYLDHASNPTQWKKWGAVAAAVAICALAITPLYLYWQSQTENIAEAFLSAHQRALIGKGVDVLSSDRHTVKPWFNGKLPFSPPVADLRADGFPLEGGRVDYAAGQTTAALVYTRGLHRIDVFVLPGSGLRSPSSRFGRNGFTEVSWKREGFLFVAVSDLNPPELDHFANLLQTR